jgi:hypothetical protein
MSLSTLYTPGTPVADHDRPKSTELTNNRPPVPIGRSKYSDFALQLIDQRGLRDAEDPEVLMIGLLDTFRLKTLEDMSFRQVDKVAGQLEVALAHAEMEFSRIDLAVKALHEFVGRLNSFEKRFSRTTNKVLRQNVASVAINHVMPLVYVLFGIALCFALQKLLGRL